MRKVSRRCGGTVRFSVTRMHDVFRKLFTNSSNPFSLIFPFCFFSGDKKLEFRLYCIIGIFKFPETPFRIWRRKLQPCFILRIFCLIARKRVVCPFEKWESLKDFWIWSARISHPAMLTRCGLSLIDWESTWKCFGVFNGKPTSVAFLCFRMLP